MSVLFEIAERSTAWLLAKFFDRSNQPETPSGVVYEIWDVTSDTIVKNETSLTPAPEIEITLSSADNLILDQKNFREARKVIVTASYGGAEKMVQDFVYHVRNIAYKTT